MSNFNLALNTIFYVSIFIFPGILFRKFLFIRKDYKQFYFGNLFERIIWTLFFSIISLVLTATFVYLLRSVLELRILPSLTFQTVLNIHESLSANKIPPREELKEYWLDFAYLLFSIYLVSIIMGVISHFFSNKLKFIGIFKYQNYWEDLLKSNDAFKGKDNLTYLQTQADILIETSTGDKLYSGIIADYFLDNNFKLQTVVLLNALRYKKDDGDIQVKSIPGNHFILNEDRILNINLTYVYHDKENSNKYKYIENFITLILFIVWISLFISVVFIDIEIFSVSIFKKIFILVIGAFLLAFLSPILNGVFTKTYSKISVDLIYTIVFLFIIELYIFNILSLLMFFIVEFAALVLFAFIMSKVKKNK